MATLEELAYLPTLADATQPRGNWFTSGLQSGFQGLLGSGGSAVQALGRAIGAPSVEEWGAQQAAQHYAQAEEAGRPELEIAPWREGGGGLTAVPQWAGYQVAKGLPSLAGAIAATALLPEAAVPAELAAIGETVPAVLGGGAGVGAQWARGLVGGLAANYLPVAGGLYHQAVERGEPTRGEAVKSLLGAVPVAAAGALLPAQLQSSWLKGFEGHLLGRVATAGVGGAAAGAVQSGVQTAAELTMRPDITPIDKMRSIVDSVATGGVFGGIMGGATGALRRAEPSQISDAQLKSSVDEALGRAQPLAEEPQQPAEPVTFAKMQEEAASWTPEQRAEQTASLKKSLQSFVGQGARRSESFQTFLHDFDAATMPEFVAALKEQVDLADATSGGKLPSWLKPLAATYGLVAPDGGIRDIPAEIEALKAQPNADPAALARLQQTAELHGVVDQILEAKRGGVNAVPVGGPEGLDVQPFAEAGREMAEGNAQGGLAAAIQGQAAQPSGEAQKPPEVTPSTPVPQEAMSAPAQQVIETKAQRLAREEAAVTPEAIAAAKKAQAAKFAAWRAKNPPKPLGEGATQPDAQIVNNGLSQPDERPDSLADFVARKSDETGARAAEREKLPLIAQQAPHPMDADLLGMMQAGSKSSDLQRYLVENHADPNVRAIAQSLLRFKVDPELILTTPEEMPYIRMVTENSNTAALYDARDNSVRIVDPNNLAQTLLHEWIHPATLKALEANTQSAREMQKLFDYTKSRHGDDTYAFTNVPEFVAEAMSNPRTQEFLKNLYPFTDRPTLDAWQAMKNIAFKLLRMPDRARTMFDQVMDTGQRLMSENYTLAGEKNPDGTYPLINRPGTVLDSDEQVKAFMQRADDMAGFARHAMGAVGSTLYDKLFGLTLGWRNLTDIGFEWGKEFHGAIMKVDELFKQRDAFERRFQEPKVMVTRAAQALQTANPKAWAIVNDLMQASIWGIDPTRTWGQSQELWGRPNWQQLRSEVARVNQQWNRLNQMPDANGVKPADIYHALATSTRSDAYARLALMVYMHAGNILGAETVAPMIPNPAYAYLENSAAHESPGAMHDFWKATAEGMVKTLAAYADQRESQAAMDLRTLGKAMKEITPLRERLQEARDVLPQIERTPNFHFGRFGDFAVSAKLKLSPTSTLENPQVDQRVIPKIQKLLEDNNFGDVRLIPGSDKQSLFMRVENRDQAEALYGLMQKAQKNGWLDSQADLWRGSLDDLGLARGKRPEQLEQLMSEIEARKLYDSSFATSPEEKAKLEAGMAELKRQMKVMVADMYPGSSIAKIWMKREGVPGYHGDMLQNFADRSSRTAYALGRLATMNDLRDAFGNISGDVKAARSDPNADPFRLQQVANEVFRRQLERPFVSGRSFIELARSGAFSWFLSASPAYLVTQFSQVPQVAWAELSRSIGATKAAKALWDTTEPMLKIMTAVLRGEHAADATISEGDLIKAGIPRQDVRFMMGVVNRGLIDLGSMARELGRVAGGVTENKWDRFLHYANSSAVLAETATRVWVALAARDVHGQLTQRAAENISVRAPAALEPFVDNVLKQAMMSYNLGSIPRQIGKTGVIGQGSPFIFQFSNYDTQIIGKLYRELSTALGAHAATAEERAESRQFLATHLAATAMIAGTMGLPAMGVFGWAASHLGAALTGDQEYDANAAWRSWLGHVFGKGIGEVLAKGLPRAAGIDLSNLGEQDLIPFTGFLADRRKIEEALPAWLNQTSGASANIAYNLYRGARDFANGNYLQALHNLVPRALKGPVEAYRMSQYGFLDQQNRKLPMDVTTERWMMQALGFTPSVKAEYNEQEQTLTLREEIRSFESANIRKNLATALERFGRGEGQREDVLQWIQTAREFDREHPLYAVLPQIGATLQQRMRAEAIAKTTHLPLGAPMRDIRMQQALTGWANY